MQKYFPWESIEKCPWNSMEIDVLILHGIPWRILHGNPWNSMEVFHAGIFLEVSIIFQALLPSLLQQRFHLILYTDGQLQLIDISSNHNLPSVIFEFVCPASCYHLRPSLCLFSKMCPPLVVSLETVGPEGTCRSCKNKTKQTAARN